MQPGELLLLDVKKLGRILQVGHRITGDRRGQIDGAGWEYVHVAVDDCSRVAFCQAMPDEEGFSAYAFLRDSVAYCAGLGATIRQLLTDNGVRYRTKNFEATCANGITSVPVDTYGTSAERINALPRWLPACNWHRPQAGLAGQPPTSRFSLDRNNMLRLHI